MTGGSIREYAEAMRKRYWKADRKGKGWILHEFIAVTGYHRKSAIRLMNREALDKLNRLYELEHLWVNFFQPVSILQSKSRHGARVHKVYDAARTPYQRLLASGILSQDQEKELEKCYRSTNPIQLKLEIEATLRILWKHAVYPARHPANET